MSYGGYYPFSVKRVSSFDGTLFCFPASGTFAVKPAKKPCAPHKDRLPFGLPPILPTSMNTSHFILFQHIIMQLSKTPVMSVVKLRSEYVMFQLRNEFHSVGAYFCVRTACNQPGQFQYFCVCITFFQVQQAQSLTLMVVVSFC